MCLTKGTLSNRLNIEDEKNFLVKFLMMDSDILVREYLIRPI
jgi:hypothetical protein